MLEGLEISILCYKDIFESDCGRVDSEFYGKQFLAKKVLLERLNCKKLSEISTVTDGEHGSPELDDNSGIAYLSGNNVKENYIDFDNVRYCSLRLHEKNLRSSVKRNSVLMSIVGTVGKASVVNTDVLANTDRNVATIKNISKDISPFYLSVFLNSKYGQFQTERFSTGNVQPLLNLLQVKSIVVPVLSDVCQFEIQSVLKYSELQRIESKSVYSQAETMLLDALNLTGFSPSTENSNIKSFKESFAATGRLDAEYYQPKFDELEAKIAESHELVSLGSLLTINQRGTQPDYADEGLPVVNSKHVREGEVVLTDNRLATLSDKENPLVIQQGDVLINGTGVGTIGRSAPYLHEQNAIPDNHVTILRTDKLNPIFLSVYLNSIAGKYQVDKYFKGSSGQIELYPKDIECFYVPLVDEKIQTEIANLVKQSFTLKNESARLLDVAKRAVEIAIEQDETAALAYIEANTVV